MSECIEKTAKGERQGVGPQSGRRKSVLQVEGNPSKVSPYKEDNQSFPAMAQEFRAQDYVPARVTWYSDKMGHGLASIFGDAETCFIHREALVQAGLRTLAPGDAIAIKIGRGNCGRYAASIRRRNLVNDQKSLA